MGEGTEQFNNENSVLFARMKELAFRVEQLKISKEIAEEKVRGLEYQLKLVKEDVQKNEKDLERINKLYRQLKSRSENIQVLEKQNFKITDKITRLVTDIKNQEDKGRGWKELIETIVEELDICIELLENKNIR